MRRTYHSDRTRRELLVDVRNAHKTHGAQSREYKRTYMRWYRATHPELRAKELETLMEWRRAQEYANR